MRASKTFIPLLAVALLLPTLAFAQKASLTGLVRDTSGAILPGVTVEASSPVLIEKVRSAISDGTGQYRIIDLDPGTYEVTFSLPGFTKVIRQGVEISGTAVFTINAEMRVGAIEETITVTGETPVVDVQSVRRETVMNADAIAAIPATRTVGSLLNATPGITVDNNGIANTPTMTFFSARGGATNEGRMAVNGMTVAAAFNGGGVSSYILDSVNVDEVSVTVSGGLGESDTGGPVMNLVPRAGGNAFRGQAFLNSAGEWSKGNNLDDELRAVNITEPPGVISAYDASISYGGPIKRDRLWFFGSYRKLDTSTSLENLVANANAFNPASWHWTPDTAVTGRQLQGRTMYIGRATVQATSKHRFTGSHEYQLRCEGAPLKVETEGCHNRESEWIAAGNVTQSPEANTLYFDFPYYLTQATWTAPMTSRLLLEAGYSRLAYYHAGGPGALPPDGIFDGMIGVTEQSTAFITGNSGPRWAPRANYNYRALQNYSDNYGNPNHWRASASYVTGSHNVKIGYQGSYLVATTKTVTPDHLLAYRFNNGSPNAYTFRLPDWETRDHTKVAALFVQDAWTTGRLTLAGALRYDRAWSYSPANGNGTTATSIYNSAPLSFDRVAGVDAYHDITPRIGVAYDVFGTGRTAVKINFGHYLDAAVNDGIFDDNNPARRTVSMVANRSWTDNDGDKVIDCSLTNFGAQSPATGAVDTCGALTGDQLNFGRTAQNLERVDPAVLSGWGVRQNDWQLGFNVQHEIVPRVSIEFGYNRRWWDYPATATDGIITDDENRGPGDYDAFTLIAPVDPRLPGGGGYPMTFYTQKLAVGPRPASNLVTLEKEFGDVSDYWHGYDFTVNARMRNGLTIQVGAGQGRKIVDRCDSITKVNEPTVGPILGALQQETACYSKEPFQTTLRGWVTYTVPKIDVRLSGTFRSQPGASRTATWIVPNTVIEAALGRLPFGQQSTGTTSLNLLDLDEHRLYQDERRTQVDMRIAKILRFGGRRMDAGFDLYNLFNTNYAENFDNTYQYSAGNINRGGTWNNPTGVITPRFVRFNLTFDF
jgi:Carboxypeptidase regulatory-like domain